MDRRAFLQVALAGASTLAIGPLAQSSQKTKHPGAGERPRYEVNATTGGGGAIVNTYQQVLDTKTLVFANAGLFYVEDGRNGQMIVSANTVTAYGASIGAGTAGAATTTSGIQEAVNVGGKTLVAYNPSPYPVTTPVLFLDSTVLEGESANTVIQAQGFMSAMLQVTPTSPARRSTTKNVTLDCNHMAVSAIDFTQPIETSTMLRIERVFCVNSIGKAMILDGNEDSVVEHVSLDYTCADGLQWSIPDGMSFISHLVSNVASTGTDISGGANGWQHMSVLDSTFNTIDVVNGQVTKISGCYIANRSATVRSTAPRGPKVVIVEDSYVAIGNGASLLSLANLQGSASLRNLFVDNLDNTNCYLVNVASAVTTQAAVMVEGVSRNTNNIYLNNPANVVPIWPRNVFLRGANGIFYRSINEQSKQISFYTGTQQAPGTPSALYTVREGKCYISSTGGTGVSITINDANGTPRKSQQPAVSQEYLGPGYSINFGPFSVAPFVVVEWI